MDFGVSGGQKRPKKAFSGNHTFSARESAQIPVLQGERAETKRGLTAIAIRPRDKLGGGALVAKRNLVSTIAKR